MAITLMPHQQAASDFVVTHDFSGIWLGIGGGKSLTILEALLRIRPLGHILVVAPVPIARSTWIDEIEKWGIPMRTKSLIVDDNDRELSKAARLEAFAQIPNDPPTMYFINQELITQTPNRPRLLVPTNAALPAKGLTPQAQMLLHLLGAVAPISTDELIDAVRGFSVAQWGGKPPAKKRVRETLAQLIADGQIERQSFECAACGGNGCPSCQFGLVDQMPIKKVRDASGKLRKAIIWPFPTVIIDESQNFKTHDSNRFKALKKVRPAITRLIELTGTPAPNGLMDLWSQMYLLDQGEALGKNITAYRDKWFTPKMVPGTNTPAKWIPIPGAEADIHQRISHLVMSAKNTALVRPKAAVEDIHVRLPAPLLEDYRAFKRDLVLDIAKQVPPNPKDPTAPPSYDQVIQVVAANQAVLTSKLQQFASGTLYTADPDDPTTKGDYEIIHDEKIAMVEYLVRNNGGSPALLTYHFQSDKEQLLLKLTKAGIDVRAFDGSRAMVRAWNAGTIPVMLLHPASGGPGLNLQDGGHTIIWYTAPFSAEHWEQTNGRLDRTGQQHPVTIYRLLTRGTQDDRMPSVVAEKVELQSRLLNAVDVMGPSSTGTDPRLAALTAEISDDIAAAIGATTAAT